MWVGREGGPAEVGEGAGHSKPKHCVPNADNDHGPMLIWGAGGFGWCVYQDTLSYSELAGLGGLKIYFWLTCQAR